jgi:hypothetical protein
MNEIVSVNLVKVAVTGAWFGMGLAIGLGVIWCSWLWWQAGMRWLRGAFRTTFNSRKDGSALDADSELHASSYQSGLAEQGRCARPTASPWARF